MNIKQFLRPKVGKIVISIVLFILFPTGGLLPFSLPWFQDSVLELILRLIIDFSFLYFIACLLFWVYNKFKDRFQQHNL